MGLDIRAFQTLELRRACTIKEHQAESAADDDSPEFKAYEEAENAGWVYLYDTAWRGDGLVEGWYESKGKTTHFRAGSYGGYNMWRSTLCEIILDVPAKTLWEVVETPLSASRFTGKPFVELINFSDCEGIIGPRTSAKLAKDFREWRVRYEAHLTAGMVANGHLTAYDDWARAFELASPNGAVRFA